MRTALIVVGSVAGLLALAMLSTAAVVVLARSLGEAVAREADRPGSSIRPSGSEADQRFQTELYNALTDVRLPPRPASEATWAQRQSYCGQFRTAVRQTSKAAAAVSATDVDPELVAIRADAMTAFEQIDLAIQQVQSVFARIEQDQKRGRAEENLPSHLPDLEAWAERCSVALEMADVAVRRLCSRMGRPMVRTYRFEGPVVVLR